MENVKKFEAAVRKALSGDQFVTFEQIYEYI